MLNQPYFACPHCQSSLLSDSSKALLIERLQTELAETIVKEEEDAERAREDARRAEGAFPMLGMNSQPGPIPSSVAAQKQPQRQPQPQAHKVLSLNSKTKKVTMASYTSAPAPQSYSGQAENTRDAEPKPVRVPPPPPRDVGPRAILPQAQLLYLERRHRRLGVASRTVSSSLFD